MIRTAIVEDAAFDRQVLQDCLREYGQETGTELQITEFTGGAAFLERYPEDLDLIFMDIMMDGTDGLTTARKLRRRDDKVLLVFVTSMLQYAVQGYSVDAMDFIIKPVTYTGLKLCMDRVVRRLNETAPVRLRFTNREGTHSVDATEICYIESLEHKIVVHTVQGEIQSDMSLAAAEKMVKALPFFRCHVSYLVNLRYVDRVSGNDVWVNGDRLAISRYRRKDFLEAWSAWLG